MRLPPVFFDTAAWIDVMAGEPIRAYVEAASRGALGLGTGHTSDYVLLETFSFLLKRNGRQVAIDFLDVATRSEFVLHPSDADLVDRAMKRARGRALKRELSLVDWTSAVLMEDHGIHHIFTKDRAFGQLGFVLLP
jgi:predicted nucleic acid-binding protein